MFRKTMMQALGALTYGDSKYYAADFGGSRGSAIHQSAVDAGFGEDTTVQVDDDGAQTEHKDAATV